MSELQTKVSYERETGKVRVVVATEKDSCEKLMDDREFNSFLREAHISYIAGVPQEWDVPISSVVLTKYGFGECV